MNKNVKKVFVKVGDIELMHGILKEGICCVFPLFGGWDVNYYLHIDCIEELQENNCEVLRFKDVGGVAEINLSKVLIRGFISPIDNTIQIQKKWAVTAQNKLF